MGYRPRDREQAMELALELLATGRIRGVSPGHQPAQLEQLLGRPFDEGIANFSGNLVRSWGLLEAYYQQEHEGAPWRGILLMGQMHRMRKPLKWKLIARELRTLGYEVTPVPRPTLEDRYYRVVESGSEAVVNGEDTGWPRGHIAKVSASDWLPLAPPSITYEFNAVHRGVYAATAEPERSWAGWLAVQQPKPQAEWFRLTHAAVHTVIREHPERAQYATALHDWLLGRAEAEHVWSATEQVLLAARCAGGAFGPLAGRTGMLSHDAIIDRCLAVLPLTYESAQLLPTAWRELTPSDVKRSKLARGLLQAANQLRDQAEAQHVISKLTGWDDVLAKL